MKVYGPLLEKYSDIQEISRDLSDKLLIAVDICRRAGQIVLGHFEGEIVAEYKGDIDLVTVADRKSEKFIVEQLGKLFPDHLILAEEGSGTESGWEMNLKKGYKWIIDPLDGTTNFTHDYPHFAISIGLELDGKVIFGVIYSPLSNEMFVAVKGMGATLNGKRISVSTVSSLGISILATGFPYDRRTNLNNNVENFSKFINKVQGIRRAGAATLDLCYLACGRIDGFWELRLKPWDVAAGIIIVEEAGGKVTNLEGGPFNIYRDDILASNGYLHEEMQMLLNNDRVPLKTS
ncbi:MAG: inositol monophosphatase family protein [Candidatus Thermoplasmatota archaeon]|jgi:myo-inositol-1(or 4)-monophosphatase|nr:inositol monophosphatase family protein [Candidatus Thermoplasmatota archaeon]MDP7265236.1 inositol monophosphatase family protein [Candidatus Thermoplasmatota archaeon]